MSKTASEHKSTVPTNIGFSLIIISTSRFEAMKLKETVVDPSGDLAIDLLREVGYSVVSREIVSDEDTMIKASLGHALENPSVDIIVTCGGTGITPTDVTIETLEPLLDKTLPGFGEVFRGISYIRIGTPAILTRATAGLIGGKAVFCLPGSPQAVELAFKELIIPEAGHIIKHARG
ncbi:MAG: molybdopterin adenylyltransferase [Thermoproteota archaeon]|nr:molybdopterin adenylyltransferase [Thermoproteota archaeon]